MIKQLELIERVKAQCISDPKIIAAMMYGSFAKGSGDAYSDIEFVLYVAEEQLAFFDKRIWFRDVYPTLLIYENEFGVTNVIFEGLIRGEFHFCPSQQIQEVSSWKRTDWFPSLESTLIVDRTGELTRQLKELVGSAPVDDFKGEAQFVVDTYFGWLLFGWSVLHRGEIARAHSLLWWVQWRILSMLRLRNDQVENWLTPTKALENEIPEEDYRAYDQCTSDLDRQRLTGAYRNAWRLGKQLTLELKARAMVNCDEALVEAFDRAIG